MNRILFALSLIALLGSMASCSGGNKACAAYAKHDEGAHPKYSDVQ